MIGSVRPLARYAAPRSRRQRTGDVDGLSGAKGLSLPRGERPSPMTVIAGLTALSASYDEASSGSYEAQATGAPAAVNWGRQNWGWFGSLPTTKSATWG